jgi:hypothetical protein
MKSKVDKRNMFDYIRALNFHNTAIICNRQLYHYKKEALRRYIGGLLTINIFLKKPYFIKVIFLVSVKSPAVSL